MGGAVDQATGTVRTTLGGFSRYAVMAYDQSFADLSSHWSKSDVEVLVSRRIVNGTTDSTFEPDRLITRVEMAKLLVAMLRANLTTPKAPTFSDVAPGARYYSSVETAARLGLVKGDGGKFRPDETITREELATMLLWALGLENQAAQTDGQLPFADATAVSGWAKGYVTLAWQKSFVNGMTADSFGPQQAATRAQAAVMILRALTWQGQIITPVTVSGQVTVSDVEGRHYEMQVGGWLRSAPRPGACWKRPQASRSK